MSSKKKALKTGIQAYEFFEKDGIKVFYEKRNGFPVVTPRTLAVTLDRSYQHIMLLIKKKDPNKIPPLHEMNGMPCWEVEFVADWILSSKPKPVDKSA